MAQSAKDYAKEQLGSLDLSHLDQEKTVAQDTYNTSKSTLENNFNNLMAEIAAGRTDANKNFSSGRTTIAEDAYTQNKTNDLSLASRGVGNGGLSQLAEVGNRMETGKQYSNLANEYYDTVDSLNTTESQSKTQHGLDQENIKNVLNQTLAGIDSRGADANNQYNMTLGQLTESTQGRWDANANAKASLEQQERLAQQQMAQASALAKEQNKMLNEQDLHSIVSSGRTEAEMAADLTTRFGIDNQMAYNLLMELGLSDTLPNTGGVPYYKYSGSNNNYLGDLREMW